MTWSGGSRASAEKQNIHPRNGQKARHISDRPWRWPCDGPESPEGAGFRRAHPFRSDLLSESALSEGTPPVPPVLARGGTSDRFRGD
eukprot:scaffold875_cov120-Isochrysis_galbana.AAC.3